MTALRPRSLDLARTGTDAILAVSLLVLVLTGEPTVWLHLAYIAAAVYAFIAKRPWAILTRSAAVSLVGGADLVHLHLAGRVPADELLEIPMMTVLSLLFSGFAVLRERDKERLVADRVRLAEQIDALPLATAAFDADARVITWNRGAEELFGWSRDEVMGRPNPTVTEQSRAESDTLHRSILDGTPLRGIEVTRRRRDGRDVELALFSAPLEAGSGLGFLVVYEEIGERKRAERERDAAQIRYRELVEALPLVTYVDRVDDHATNLYTSPQVEDLLGWPVEDWTSRPAMFEELLHPDDRERVMSLIRASNEARAPFGGEYRLRHRDGHWVWVRDQSTIVDHSGDQPFARGFLLDITQQKALEEQLVQAQKMEALGQLAGGIAHDFNNLLTGIGGYADLAAASVEPGSSLARYLEGITSAAGEAASLTSRLLAFSRRDVPSHRLLDLNDAVRAAAGLLERLVRETIALRLDLAPGLPAIAADPVQLKQVLLNLAVNAADAMPAGGSLVVETAAAGDRVVLRVHDDGCGMDDETRLRALEPFFTTKPAGEGTGLGLSVVYGVVEQLGGTLAIDSTPGEGTVVEITLPAQGGVAEAAPGGGDDDAAGGTERVLVVEDRAVVRRLAHDLLAAAGFVVVTAADAPEALAIVEREPRFDLVLSDVVLPGISGPGLVERLRAVDPGLPVVYMSGYTDDVLAAETLEAPSTAFVRKPFSRSALVNAVRSLLDGQDCAPLALASAPSPMRSFR